MKILGISNNRDTAIGLKLGGIDTIIIKQSQEVKEKIEQITANENIGILVITNEIYEMASKEIDNIIYNRKLPLIVKI